MAHSGSMRRVFFICASLVMAASCTGSQTQTSSLVPSQPGERASWMASDAKTQDLLYVSHGNGSVYAYSYGGGKLEGGLLGLRASGLCSDQRGDVFVLAGNEVLKYAHGGTAPLAVLRNSLGGVSQFCAVDPVTGNLAVLGGAYPQTGVEIYTEAQASPKIYRPGKLDGGYWSCAYDDEGNLFVEAGSQARSMRLAVNMVELAAGSMRFKTLTWNGAAPPRLGPIQWDGRYVAVENASGGSGPATIYRYAVQADRAALVGQTALQGAANPTQFWIHGGNVVVPGGGLSPNSAGITFYGYPSGGSPARIIKDALDPQAATVSIAAQPKLAVTTYHYDNLRTGWDDSETTLSYENVSNGSFGLLHAIALDDQVDAQPLIVPGEKTTRGAAPGRHDVIYVATESNTVYAIDASRGNVLFKQNLGNPVPYPLGCNNNGPNVGINGTPVIDPTANVMYVIAYTLQSGVPTYTIHELNLANLTDAVAPVVVSASHMLLNGTTYTFNATYQRQRPALLEANGNVYAGFGSFCDYSASVSRGWLLGWQTGSLTPLPANRLNDMLAVSPDDFFLSSIWMSGYGLAADSSGNVYFVTGNSDPNSYNGVTNVQESVVKVSSDLTQLLSIFTPSGVTILDEGDVDFGSGGVLLLPTTAQSVPPLAAAAGKKGTMYLLDQDNLGGYTAGGPNNDLDAKKIGGCWCGESYFDAATDSVPRIVASGGNYVTVWKVRTSPTVKLFPAGTSAELPGGQDPGFFTTISSDGSSPGAIIWAVARPQTAPGNITLFAFKSQPQSGSSSLETLYSASAGSWEDYNGNANIVPVVANGKVYVASYKQLDIFGIGGRKASAATAGAAAFTATGAPHEITGTLVAVNGAILALRTRTGEIARIDDSVAVRRERSSDLVAGEPFTAWGSYDTAGILHAVTIVRAKPSRAMWPPDR